MKKSIEKLIVSDEKFVVRLNISKLLYQLVSKKSDKLNVSLSQIVQDALIKYLK